MTDPRTFSLESTYLNQQVRGAHRIHLELTEDGPGRMTGHLRLDPNRCSLDGWGDPQGCTKMGFRSVAVEAHALRVWDPQGHRRVSHALRLEGSDDNDLHLIEYGKVGLWYLVHRHKEQGTDVVPLFPADWFRFDAAGTVQTRYGVPLREVTARGDLAEMKAEAELVRRALAELDAEPAAPQAAPRREADAVGADRTSEVRAALQDLEAAIQKLEG